MNARPPPDPRAARIRDLVSALLEEGSGTRSAPVEWAPGATSPPGSKRGSDLMPQSRRGGDLGPPSRRSVDLAPPSRRSVDLASPSRLTEDPAPTSRRGLDLAPTSRRGLDLGPPSRRSIELTPPLPLRATPISASPPPDGDALDGALAGLEALSREMATMRASFAEANRRLTELMEVVVALVSFDYEKKAFVGDKSDVFDGMASGLNMLGEELSITTLSKAYIDNIIESMSDLLVVTDRHARIRTVNQSACDLVGIPMEELISQPVDMLFDDLSAADLIDTGGVRDQERSCRVRGGKSVRVSFSAAVMRNKRGAPEGLVCVARDLTEAKRIEEERWRLREAVQRQSIILEELSTPLIPITDEILVMPLIGTVDERRAGQIVDTLLQGVVSRRARVAIIDITGIRNIEDAGVEGILNAVKAVRLVGAEVALTGIRPEVARLLVAQGYDLSAIRTFGSLQNGIVHAMKRARGAATTR